MKTFICRKCGARFTSKDIVSSSDDGIFKCPKCGERDAELFEDRGLKRREWKPLGSFIKDNG